MRVFGSHSPQVIHISLRAQPSGFAFAPALRRGKLLAAAGMWWLHRRRTAVSGATAGNCGCRTRGGGGGCGS